MTGIGTIDRLKKKASDELETSDEEPLPLQDVFGIQSVWTWFLPIDPVFEDFDRVFGYSIPSRLKRERQMFGHNPNRNVVGGGIVSSAASATSSSFSDVPWPTKQQQGRSRYPPNPTQSGNSWAV